jgi:hypothetical protein
VSTVARAALVAAALVVAVPFLVATTFHGDDYVFLAFARHAPDPLVAFVRDQHGGEFYRPLPMLLWWLGGRAGGGSPLPFALLALGLHAGAALMLRALLGALGRPPVVAWLAAGLFAAAPQNLEVAYWYSASTDLLATLFVLGALAALARGRAFASAALALAAYLSKESALVLPALAVLVVRAPWRRRLRVVVPHAALAAAVVMVRFRVLGGWGGSADQKVSVAGKLLQIANGLAHVATGSAVLPDAAAWALGASVIAFLAWSAGRRRDFTPLAFALVAAAPLAAASSALGARYFYLPSVGMAWAAAEALATAASRAVAARTLVLAALLAIGAAQAAGARADVVLYRRRLDQVRRAVATGARSGHRVFHAVCGIKDVDLAVKQDPALAAVAGDILVFSSVPASFMAVPPALERAAAVAIARPPIPPSGAYRFGDVRIVGQARAGDDPELEEVEARFPDLQIIRCR